MSSFARLVPTGRTVVLLAIAGMSLAACHKKKPVETPTPVAATPTVNQDSIDRARAREDSIRRAAERERAMRDSLARSQAERDAALAAARAALTAPVFFDYDQADIRDDSRAVLESKVPLLTANAAVRIRVAGHTDSRGADEYNLALGQRRAASVKSFLTERGIDASRIEIVSFGEERPTCTEEEESCWSRNRRAEFEMTGGAQTLVLPGGR